MLLYLIIGVAACLSVPIIWFFVYLKRRQDEVEENFQRLFAGKNIRMLDKTAMYIAQESDGYSHVRSIGILVLTDKELYFERRVVAKVLHIPVSAITDVGETKRLGGQNPIKTMLKISFKDHNGRDDSFALCVKELEQWINEIKTVMAEKA